MTTITQTEYEALYHARESAPESAVETWLKTAGITVEPKPAKVTLEHREGEYVHFRVGLKNEALWEFVDGEWVISVNTLYGGFGIGSTEPQSQLNNWVKYDYNMVVSHGFLTGEVTEKFEHPPVPEVGQYVKVTLRTGEVVEGTVTSLKDNSGCEGAYKDIRIDGAPAGQVPHLHLEAPCKHHGRDDVVAVERVYAQGDTLPAGEPMPANGLVEYYTNGGKRYYVETGFVASNFDVKILWLEEDAK